MVNEDECKEMIFKGFHHYRCSRKAKKDGFCIQHHPDSKEKRKKEAELRYEEQKKHSPWHRLGKAIDCIKDLKAALESIANNTCCDKCQEAALVAKKALDRDWSI